MMISSINVNANLIQRGELKDNATFSFCHQTYNWKMPHVILSLNVWWIELRQHTIFTVVTDKTLWSRKCSRSAVFLKKHLCANKRKRSSVRFLSTFSNVFVWASRRRAMEISWKLHSIGPIWAAGRYLPQYLHLLKLTSHNRKSNFKTRVAENIPYVVP